MRSTGILGGRGAMVGVLAAIAVVGVLAVLLAIFVLPQATITVSPPLETVGPVSRTLTADPAAIEVDETNGVIPAESVKIPLSAQGDFTATGVKVVETKAKGAVTFSNFDTSGKRTIPAGSIVATDSDVRFRTLEPARLAKAEDHRRDDHRSRHGLGPDRGGQGRHGRQRPRERHPQRAQRPGSDPPQGHQQGRNEGWREVRVDTGLTGGCRPRRGRSDQAARAPDE